MSFKGRQIFNWKDLRIKVRVLHKGIQLLQDHLLEKRSFPTDISWHVWEVIEYVGMALFLDSILVHCGLFPTGPHTVPSSQLLLYSNSKLGCVSLPALLVYSYFVYSRSFEFPYKFKISFSCFTGEPAWVLTGIALIL